MLRVILNEWLHLSPPSFFYSAFIKIQWNGVLTALFGCSMAGAMWNCCHLSASSVHTIQLCISLLCHFIQRYAGRMQVCLAVNSHLHFWQNGRSFTCYCGNKGVEWLCQHRKLTLKKNNLLPLPWTWDILIESDALTTKLLLHALLTLDGENPPIPSMSKQCLF